MGSSNLSLGQPGFMGSCLSSALGSSPAGILLSRQEFSFPIRNSPSPSGIILPHEGLSFPRWEFSFSRQEFSFPGRNSPSPTGIPPSQVDQGVPKLGFDAFLEAKPPQPSCQGRKFGVPGGIWGRAGSLRASPGLPATFLEGEIK